MCSSSNQSKKNIWFLILCDLFRAQTCILVRLQGQGVKCCAMCCATCYLSLPHVQWITCCSIVICCVMRFVFSAMRSANKLLHILSGVDKFQATNSYLHVLPQWGIMVGLFFLPLVPLINLCLVMVVLEVSPGPPVLWTNCYKFGFWSYVLGFNAHGS